MSNKIWNAFCIMSMFLDKIVWFLTKIGFFMLIGWIFGIYTRDGLRYHAAEKEFEKNPDCHWRIDILHGSKFEDAVRSTQTKYGYANPQSYALNNSAK